MEPNDLTYEVCRGYVKDQVGVNPTLIAKIDGYRRSRNLEGLASCSCNFDPALHGVTEWKFLRQVEAFFKKNASFSAPEVCRLAAQASFFEAEEACSATNLRLKPFMRFPHLLDADLRKKVERMKRYISGVLGDYAPFLEQLPALVKVTSGATSHTKRRESLPQMKMRMKVYATRRAQKYLRCLYHYYGFRQPRFKTTHSNRVELVPKNWKTDRTIACEPEGNLPLQLAFDTYAKRRLRLYGINLSNQFANQSAAKEASIHNHLVTVDFSKASDTISFNTVSWLFPPDWFSYLWDVRTPAFRGVFGEGVYSKFSSMGNGSTFVIETLLFAAACHAVGSKGFLVYGDDVIIEKEHYADFIALTGFLGFSINTEKSFHDGPFRESCGADWYNGADVTPTFIKNVDKRKAMLCHLVNTVGRLTYPGGELEAILVGLIRSRNLPRVPYQESTIAGVWIDPAVARKQGILKRRGHIDYARAYLPSCKRACFVDSRGYYLWFLNKNSQVLFGAPWALANGHDRQSSETSSAPVFDHAYVRKRVCWHPPAEAMPDHVYMWSELLNPR